MLCCKPKQDEYDIEAEEIKDTLDTKEKPKKNGTNSQVNDLTCDANVNVDEVIAAPVEVKVTEAELKKTECNVTELEKQSSSDQIEAENKKDADEIAKRKYETQTSVASQLSVRDGINRSREKFFSSGYSLNESPLLQDDKSVCSITDLRFAEHQRKIRGHSVINEDNVMSAEQMQDAVKRLEAVAAKLELMAVCGVKQGSSGSGSAEANAVSPFVCAYDDMLNGELAKFLDLSSKIGGEVQTQAVMVKKGFQVLKDFLVIASKSKKPAQAVLVGLLTPLSQQITEIQEFKEQSRRSPLFNHLSGIAESIPALGWVSVEPTPGPYVKDMVDAGMFYTNRVIKEYKEKDQTHVDWTKAWLATLNGMKDYIKDHHTTGVSWNAQGGDASAAAGGAPAPAAGGAPPPPPPGPPPPPPPPSVSAPATGGDDGRSALFADLSRGTAVTTGLKKVTDDMKTHKNPALKTSSTVPGVRVGPTPFKAAAPPKTAPKPVMSAPVVKPPVFELKDKKWMIEYQIGNKTMMVEDTNLKQSVYMFKCQDSVLQVKGKINQIILDSCKKVSIAFDAVVSSVEFVNCQSVQAQVMEQCPTVSIEKTDGCMMYLSKDSLNAEIITAKSSEMNILVPNDEGEFTEYALPEQFKNVWDGKKFKTECSDV